MSSSRCNERGITIIEVLITLFLTAVGIMALLSMQPISWQTAGRSDFMGRAAGILQSELERNEVRIMNPLLSVSTGTTTRTVYPSNLTGGTTPQKGDVAYTVATTISSLGSTAWRVDVRVTWPGNNRGIAESMTVTRQETFRQ
ncbi:MAG TPA: prepilin-type N-terminal cleavage/methylation domain-containing protein [Syntrophales bacterium]|nr:prepilin-type N-terminal cleavage/methylation domain-containing protein [Syntrophales bacterium]